MIALVAAAHAGVWAVDHRGTIAEHVRWESRMLVADDLAPVALGLGLREVDLVAVEGGSAIVDQGWVVGVRPDGPFVTVITRGEPPLVADRTAIQQIAVGGRVASWGEIDPAAAAERMRRLGRPLLASPSAAPPADVRRFADRLRRARLAAFGLAGALVLVGIVVDRRLERAARRERVRAFLAER